MPSISLFFNSFSYLRVIVSWFYISRGLVGEETPVMELAMVKVTSKLILFVTCNKKAELSNNVSMSHLREFCSPIFTWKPQANSHKSCIHLAYMSRPLKSKEICKQKNLSQRIESIQQKKIRIRVTKHIFRSRPTAKEA